MKAKLMLILAVLLALLCFPAAQAVDYVPATEEITVSVTDPLRTETKANYIFTDLKLYWGTMLIKSDKEITEEAVWDMQVCADVPDMIRWVDSAGNSLEVDLSMENPLNTIAYTEAESGKMVIFDLANLTATEITATGPQKAVYEDLPFFAMAMYQEQGSDRVFGINLYSIQALINAKFGAEDSGEEEAAESAYEKEDFTGKWVSTDLSYYIDITTDSTMLRKLEILASARTTSWELGKERITFKGSSHYDKFEYLDIVEENGDLHLVNGDCVFVRPEEYARTVETYALGDTAVSESAEIAVNGVEFTTLPKEWISDEATPDQQYIKISFDVTNNSKELFNYQEDVHFFVDYKDGFTYLTHFEPLNTVWVHPATGNDLPYHGSGGSSVGGFKLDVSPLDTESAEVYIPVPDKVASDNESPLRIYLSIPDGDESMGYCFVVR